MSDVMVYFINPLPLRTNLKGEVWEVAACQQNKSGKRVAIIAFASGKSYTLWTGNDRQARIAALRGFVVKGGTPERGLVTELRRAGHVRLEAVKARGNGEEEPEFGDPIERLWRST